MLGMLKQVFMGEIAFVARPDASALSAQAKEMLANGAWAKILSATSSYAVNQLSHYPYSQYRVQQTGYRQRDFYWPASVVSNAKSVRNYVNQLAKYKVYAEAMSKEKGQAEMALHKQLNDLKLQNEMAQAEVTQARMKSQQLADQLKNSILEAQLKQEQAKLDEALEIQKSESARKEAMVQEQIAKEKKAKLIKRGGIATAVATGAYFFLT
jgi:hypothetical protein